MKIKCRSKIKGLSCLVHDICAFIYINVRDAKILVISRCQLYINRKSCSTRTLCAHLITAAKAL